MGRLSDIRRADDAKFAFDNYMEWLDNRGERTVRRIGGPVGERRRRVEVFIKPWTIDFDFSALTFRNPNSNTKLGTLGGRVISADDQSLANGTLTRLPRGAKVAKVYLFESGGTRTREESEITGLNYLKYEGQNFMSPFGRSVENESFKEASRGAVLAARASAAGSDIVRAWFTPEKSWFV